MHQNFEMYFPSCHDLFMNLSWFAWNPITGLFESEAEVWKAEVWEPLIEVSYICLILWNDNNINKCILYSYRQTQLLKNG